MDLCRRHSNALAVEFPSPRTDGNWVLTPLGRVGRIPLDETRSLVLEPKTPIANLFRMLEYAYNVSGLEFLDGAASSGSIEDVYEKLAHVLSKRIIDRARKGLYRSYVSRSEDLSVVRERLDVQRIMRKPWRVSPHCHYHELTTDVEENQLLAWTLFVLMRARLDREDVRRSVRRAHRTLQGSVSQIPFDASDCIGRSYTRLTDDYRPLHAICRFFLEFSGPSVYQGDKEMIPFLVDMGQLFEAFVGEWMSRNLPEGFRLVSSERYQAGIDRSFILDLVLYDIDTAGSQRARYVIDTKYKAIDASSNSDVYQAVTYALAKGCTEAVLVYPTPLRHPLDIEVGGIRVRSATFDLRGDLEDAGSALLRELGLVVEKVAQRDV